MFCPRCGKELSYDCSFCPNCGTQVVPSALPAYTDYNTRELKEPSTLGPFLLGFFLFIIGLIIAAIIYKNDGHYTKDPTTHAIVWSLIGMLTWIPVLVVFLLIVTSGTR